MGKLTATEEINLQRFLDVFEERIPWYRRRIKVRSDKVKFNKYEPHQGKRERERRERVLSKTIQQ